MSDKQSKDKPSKRQMMREQRAKKERQQRLITIGVIAVIGVILVGVIIVPTAQKMLNPIGNFERITPVAYQNINATAMGDPNAKVKIEIFEDFQCSACKSYAENIEPQVIKNIVEPGTAYYIFYQYPFLDDASNFKDSDQAANAAECAAEQNRFWDFKDMLFANQNHQAGDFSEDRLAAFAKTVGLDTGKFNACYAEKRYQSKIDQDIALGSQMNITGTPSVFVNGKNVSPGKVPTFDQIMQFVNEALATSGS